MAKYCFRPGCIKTAEEGASFRTVTAYTIPIISWRGDAAQAEIDLGFCSQACEIEFNLNGEHKIKNTADILDFVIEAHKRWLRRRAPTSGQKATLEAHIEAIEQAPTKQIRGHPKHFSPDAHSIRHEFALPTYWETGESTATVRLTFASHHRMVRYLQKLADSDVDLMPLKILYFIRNNVHDGPLPKGIRRLRRWFRRS